MSASVADSDLAALGWKKSLAYLRRQMAWTEPLPCRRDVFSGKIAASAEFGTTTSATFKYQRFDGRTVSDGCTKAWARPLHRLRWDQTDEHAFGDRERSRSPLFCLPVKRSDADTWRGSFGRITACQWPADTVIKEVRQRVYRFTDNDNDDASTTLGTHVWVEALILSMASIACREWVVPLHAIRCAGKFDVPVMVMENGGVPLYKYTCDWEARDLCWATVLYQVAQAIEALQDRLGIVHGDLHTGNILVDVVPELGGSPVDPEGRLLNPGLRARLIDFGASCELENGKPGRPRLVAHNMVMDRLPQRSSDLALLAADIVVASAKDQPGRTRAVMRVPLAVRQFLRQCLVDPDFPELGSYGDKLCQEPSKESESSCSSNRDFHHESYYVVCQHHCFESCVPATFLDNLIECEIGGTGASSVSSPPSASLE